MGSIRPRLQKLLMGHTENYFLEVNKKLSAALMTKKERMKLVGEARVNTDKQGTYLVRAAIRFSDFVKHVLYMKNTEYSVFSLNTRLHHAAHLHEISKAFTRMLLTKGHRYKFESDEDTDDFLASPTYRHDLYELSFLLPDESTYPELRGLLSEPFSCPWPSEGDLIKHIRQIYLHSPRDELDACGNSLLSIVFREQSERWTKLTLAHLSNVILIVHEFIDTAMAVAFVDDGVRLALQEFLSDHLLDCYRRAIKHAELLLHVECKGKVSASNPLFSALLASNREKRQKRTILEEDKDSLKSGEERNRVTVEAGAKTAITGVALPSAEQIYGDAHDVIQTYYEIARARLLDGIDQQVIAHFLLDGEQSVFQLFTPERLLSMTSEEVESIAKESPSSTRLREDLQLEIDNLEKALEVLHA
ncbi:hypothetical protein F4814DRAFT_428653 [Daldinia grandis]|nr:hypothetical protein F4814DRAFT_428653 [Daldinia grandis]